jgi:hypothetical protein
MSEAHGNASDHNHTPASPPEPKTPMWLPALGVALFLTAGFIWGLTPSNKNEAGGPAGGASAAAADAGAPSAQH